MRGRETIVLTESETEEVSGEGLWILVRSFVRRDRIILEVVEWRWYVEGSARSNDYHGRRDPQGKFRGGNASVARWSRVDGVG